MVKYTIEDLRQWAADRAGALISTRYVGATAAYEWACLVCENRWFCTWASARRRRDWCPGCASRDFQYKLVEHAAERGHVYVADWLESRPTGGRGRVIRVKCPRKGHDVAELTWKKYQMCGWSCDTCKAERDRRAAKRRVRGSRHGVMRRLLRVYGLRLEGAYVKRDWPTQYRCAQGHEFTAAFADIDSAEGGRCAICAITEYPEKHGLVVTVLGGVQFSVATTNLMWRCLVCGNRFSATYRDMAARGDDNKCASCSFNQMVRSFIVV